jgi:hypothetical protein
VNVVDSSVSRREAIVTLVACALLGFDAVRGLALWVAALLQTGGPYYALFDLLGLAGGCLLGLVLLRQGGVSVPSREEKGATAGALVGLVVGALTFPLLANVGILGICVLVGIAMGRTLDRSAIHPTS